MIKTVNWNGNELHCIEWLIDGEVEWCFLGSQVVKLLQYKDNYSTVIMGNTKTKAKIRDKYKIKVSKKEIEMNIGESPSLELSRKGDILITELGVYELIMKSDMPLAEDFQDFVFSLLKQLREKSGLKQFEAFRMMDKQVQLNVQKVVAEIGDLDNGGKNCIVMNNNVNKLISCELFGFNKALSKAEMEKYEPAMMIDRQEVLNKYMDYIIASDGSHKKAYELCSKWIMFKYRHLLVS